MIKIFLKHQIRVPTPACCIQIQRNILKCGKFLFYYINLNNDLKSPIPLKGSSVFISLITFTVFRHTDLL